MKPDAAKLDAIKAEGERAGAILGAALARADGLVEALAELDATATDGNAREVFATISRAFFEGVGRTGRHRISRYFEKP
jgi:hypothetical protein